MSMNLLYVSEVLSSTNCNDLRTGIFQRLSVQYGVMVKNSDSSRFSLQLSVEHKNERTAYVPLYLTCMNGAIMTLPLFGNLWASLFRAANLRSEA
jgi:hypothetical protein